MKPIVEKVLPFVESSGAVFGAVVGHVLGEKLTEPTIKAMTVTNEGVVLAMDEGRAEYDVFIGELGNFCCVWLIMLKVSELNKDELREADAALGRALPAAQAYIMGLREKLREKSRMQMAALAN